MADADSSPMAGEGSSPLVFIVEAKDPRSGKTVRVKIAARDSDHAVSRVRKRGFTVNSVTGGDTTAQGHSDAPISASHGPTPFAPSPLPQPEWGTAPSGTAYPRSQRPKRPQNQWTAAIVIALSIVVLTALSAWWKYARSNVFNSEPTVAVKTVEPSKLFKTSPSGQGSISRGKADTDVPKKMAAQFNGTDTSAKEKSTYSVAAESVVGRRVDEQPAGAFDPATATDLIAELRRSRWYGHPGFLHTEEWPGEMPIPLLNVCIMRWLMYRDPVQFRKVYRDVEGLKKLYLENDGYRQGMEGKAFFLDVEISRIPSAAQGKLAVESRLPFESTLTKDHAGLYLYQTDMVPAAVLSQDGGLRRVASDEWPAYPLGRLYFQRLPIATLRVETVLDQKTDLKSYTPSRLKCRVYFDKLMYAGSWTGMKRKETFYKVSAAQQLRGTEGLDLMLATGVSRSDAAPDVLEGLKVDDAEYISARIITTEIRNSSGVLIGKPQ